MSAYEVDALPNIINIGSQGEHGVTEIIFDVSTWAVLFPTAMLVATNPGVSDGLWISYVRNGETSVYPVSTSDLSYASAGDVHLLTWTIQAVLTDIPGIGTVIVHCQVGADEKRNPMTFYNVYPGHSSAETPPEPLADYIEKWGDVDVTVTGLEEGAAPTGNVTQDETGTHFALGIPKGDKGDTGNVMYASFDIDTDTGDLIMTTPDGYTGPTFALNEITGDLEVTI